MGSHRALGAPAVDRRWGGVGGSTNSVPEIMGLGKHWDGSHYLPIAWYTIRSAGNPRSYLVSTNNDGRGVAPTLVTAMPSCSGSGRTRYNMLPLRKRAPC